MSRHELKSSRSSRAAASSKEKFLALPRKPASAPEMLLDSSICCSNFLAWIRLQSSLATAFCYGLCNRKPLSYSSQLFCIPLIPQSHSAREIHTSASSPPLCLHHYAPPFVLPFPSPLLSFASSALSHPCALTTWLSTNGSRICIALF